VKPITEFLIGVVYLAIVYSLVRPGSPAAAVIKTISTSLSGVIGSATGSETIGSLTP
jgi:hypothetical protein